MELITERAIRIEEAKTDFDIIIENNKISEHVGNFKIIGTLTHVFIGLAKLEIKSQNNSDAELGYMILPRFWGKGIASQVAI